ncbi:MAG: hypothetical protein JW915_21095 [Chitinispirillaceae bacterium]|nr:hypothetical protein [Chitinispirillaceae bacterium]
MPNKNRTDGDFRPLFSQENKGLIAGLALHLNMPYINNENKSVDAFSYTLSGKTLRNTVVFEATCFLSKPHSSAKRKVHNHVPYILHFSFHHATTKSLFDNDTFASWDDGQFAVYHNDTLKIRNITFYYYVDKLGLPTFNNFYELERYGLTGHSPHVKGCNTAYKLKNKEGTLITSADLIFCSYQTRTSDRLNVPRQNSTGEPAVNPYLLNGRQCSINNQWKTLLPLIQNNRLKLTAKSRSCS